MALAELAGPVLLCGWFFAAAIRTFRIDETPEEQQ